MAVGSYKDACIDAGDPKRLAAFWAAALGMTADALDDGDAAVRDGAGAVVLWVNRVSELVTVKNRLHFDVLTESVDELVGAGATVLDAESFRWTVLWDPEGHELCAFVREEPIPSRWQAIVWDCAPSAASCRRLATWWAAIVGGDVVDDDRGFSSIEAIPGAPFAAMDFVPVPERKQMKNRIHIDVRVPGVDALTSRGATLLRPKGDGGIGWHVMADPAGNEFCAFTD